MLFPRRQSTNQFFVRKHMSRIVVRLPVVRGPLAGEETPPCLAGLPRLWPGLPRDVVASRGATGGVSAPQGPWFFPEDLPLDPRQALACLQDLQHMTDAALTGTPLRAWQGRQAESLRSQAESAARAAFAAGGGDEADALAAAEAAEEGERRCRAQRLLLLCWLQEERLAEMAALHRRYAGGRAHLAAAFDGDAGEAASLSELPDDLLRPAGPEQPEEAAALAAMLPPWPRVLDAACHFLPDEALILAEAGLRDALLEREDLVPAAEDIQKELAGDGGPRLLALTAPLWRILQRPGCPRCHPRWERPLTVLTWEDQA